MISNQVLALGTLKFEMIKVNNNVNKHHIILVLHLKRHLSMLKNTVADPTDEGTLRPNEKPLFKAGTCFNPMKIVEKQPTISLPTGVTADNPFALFRLFYTSDIINSIVQATNNYIRKPNDDGDLPYRARLWVETTPPEIYTYLAIRIYMTIFICNEISDYWSTSEFTPLHPITKYMARDRFQELHIRFRLGEDTTSVYSRVSIISYSLYTMFTNFSH